MTDDERKERDRASKRKYALANREKIRAANRKYALENPEKVRATRRKYVLANAEKVRAAKRKYALDNVEKLRAARRKYVLEHPEKVQAAKQKYVDLNLVAVAESRRKYWRNNSEKKRLWETKNKDKVRKYKRDWAKRNRKKRSAHSALKRAVSAGKVTRQPCEVCGKLETQGHHPDYSKPLAVLWLCDEHHKQAHVKERDACREKRSQMMRMEKLKK